MKTLVSIVSAAILTVAASAASAAPVQLTTDQLDNVTAGAIAIGLAGGSASGPNAYSSSRVSTHVGGWWFGGTGASASNTSSVWGGRVL